MSARLARRPAAEVYRQGFAHGFCDALRLAERRIPDPNVWAVLDALAAEYELCGCDD